MEGDPVAFGWRVSLYQATDPAELDLVTVTWAGTGCPWNGAIVARTAR